MIKLCGKSGGKSGGKSISKSYGKLWRIVMDGMKIVGDRRSFLWLRSFHRERATVDTFSMV